MAAGIFSSPCHCPPYLILVFYHSAAAGTRHPCDQCFVRDLRVGAHIDGDGFLVFTDTVRNAIRAFSGFYGRNLLLHLRNQHLQLFLTLCAGFGVYIPGVLLTIRSHRQVSGFAICLIYKKQLSPYCFFISCYSYIIPYLWQQ